MAPTCRERSTVDVQRAYFPIVPASYGVPDSYYLTDELIVEILAEFAVRGAGEGTDDEWAPQIVVFDYSSESTT